MTYLCWRCSRKDDTHTGTCRACLKAMRPTPEPPPPDRAVGGYAYLMCEDAVPVDDDTDQT